MRIVSLLPSATEIVYALGLGDQLVGVTHECDHPDDVRTKRVVTYSLLDHSSRTSKEIDQAVSWQLRNGLSLYALDQASLAELRPDLILTQALCDVCAVSYSTVQQAVRDVSASFDGIAPHVLSLEPNGLDDILTTIEYVGAAAHAEKKATEVVANLRTRIERVSSIAQQAGQTPRVACLEWIDPLFGPGHWLPELVTMAGGEPGLGTAHNDAHRITWSDVIAFAPEVVIIAPCGFNLRQTTEEASRVLPYRIGWDDLPAVRNDRVYTVDGNAYFSRPGPRIVDSLELMAELLHPPLFAGWGPPNAWTSLNARVAQSNLSHYSLRS